MPIAPYKQILPARTDRPVDYLAGAWTSKRFSGEAASRQIFQALNSEPTLIIESTLEGENLSISFGYWGLNYEIDRYFTAINFSWLEALYDFAKARTLAWWARRREDGTSEAEWIADYGEETVRKYQANLATIERERRCLDRGEDLREMVRNYHITPKDQDDLKRYIAVCHCIYAGLLADAYFLIDTMPSHSPLMPRLLPALLQGMPTEGQEQSIATVVQAYDRFYAEVVAEMAAWEPELRLELAMSLAGLPSFVAAKEQIDRSIGAWLALRQVEWVPGSDPLPLLVATVTPADAAYVEALERAWAAVGVEARVDMGPAFYRQGQDFYKRRDYPAAVADFDRAIELGVAAAIDRREITLQVMAEVQQREVEAEKVRQAQAEAERLRQEAEAEQQRQEAERIRLEEEARLVEEQRQRESEENRKGKLFTFETVYVNDRGKIDRREQKEARCLSFDLGNGVPLEMVYVPEGSFLMGTPEKEEDDDDYDNDDDDYDNDDDDCDNYQEQPQHEVTLQAFHMGKYQVTQRQYQAVMGNNPSTFVEDDLPVENVSWNDAMEFCQRLSEKIGQKFTLPSEAQWEYACRAGTTTPFYFGRTLRAKLANYDATETYGNGSTGEYREQTTDVGIFPPNAFGLYDMHGNVEEWCQDEWHDDYNGAPIDGSAWLDGSSCDYVVRGGSWFSDPKCCRSAHRSVNSRDDCQDSLGFRQGLFKVRVKKKN
jgi:formylglycine-generating enzyme required for sulfatase activity